MTKQIRELEIEYLDYFSRQGFGTERSKDLLPPNKDAGVLFMICGGIKYDNIFRGKEDSEMQQLARVQNCLRTDNDYRVGVTTTINNRVTKAHAYDDTSVKSSIESYDWFRYIRKLTTEE